MIVRYNEDKVKEKEKATLTALNKYIPAWPMEKNPEAMLNLFVSETIKEILGEDYRKEKVSQRKSTDIYDAALEKMKAYYGQWANITNWKMKTPYHARFSTNIRSVFTTDKGRLFKCWNDGILSNVFLTSHSIDRFKERVDANYYDKFAKKLSLELKAQPTAVDIISNMMTRIGKYQYASLDSHETYINIFVGIMVIDVYDEVSIVKTFLKQEMAKDVSWYESEIPDKLRVSSDKLAEEYKSFKDMLFRKSKKIFAPDTILDDPDPDIRLFKKEKSNAI